MSRACHRSRAYGATLEKSIPRPFASCVKPWIKKAVALPPKYSASPYWHVRAHVRGQTQTFPPAALHYFRKPDLPASSTRELTNRLEFPDTRVGDRVKTGRSPPSEKGGFLKRVYIHIWLLIANQNHQLLPQMRKMSDTTTAREPALGTAASEQLVSRRHYWHGYTLCRSRANRWRTTAGLPPRRCLGCLTCSYSGDPHAT
jgi:hypothetical protein